MKVPVDQRLPQDIKTLVPRLSDVLTLIARQLNAFTEGSVSSVHNALTAAPTTGTWKAGDFIRNSNPSDTGDGSAIFGWVCIASGTPGTWRKLKTETS